MKKLFKFIVCCTLVSVLSLAGLSQVSALEDGASSRAIETYTRSTNIYLASDYGYVAVTLYINHNMTTGKSYISRIGYTPHFNVSYLLLSTESISTTPGLEVNFTGAINVKITYKYKNDNTRYTAYGYIQL